MRSFTLYFTSCISALDKLIGMTRDHSNEFIKWLLLLLETSHPSDEMILYGNDKCPHPNMYWLRMRTTIIVAQIVTLKLYDITATVKDTK